MTLIFAGMQGDDVHYVQGDSLELPFPDDAFDHTIAVTSFCFMDDPVQALREMWRVTRPYPGPRAAQPSQPALPE